MTARKYNLDNPVVIIDRNNLQASGTCSEIMDHNDISMKLQAFGWKTREWELLLDWLFMERLFLHSTLRVS